MEKTIIKKKRPSIAAIIQEFKNILTADDAIGTLATHEPVWLTAQGFNYDTVTLQSFLSDEIMSFLSSKSQPK